jgi:signal transduction histidine kinase
MILISTNRARNLARQQMEFVAGVSHELRTPLAVIRSAGENLADGVIGEKQQIQRYGKLIATEGRRLTDMVEQILEFSGIQSGRKNYHLRPAPVVDIVDHAIAACHAMIEEGGFEITKELERDLPMVAADEAALSRSLQNLLTNAMKYSGNSRRIEIRASNRKAGNKQQVEITVADSGLGIEADDLPHIFEPFYRGREATAAQIHGSGLGLSLVKQIVEAHNGSVSVQSDVGKGSAFTLQLPATQSLESGVWSLESDAELRSVQSKS